MGILLRERATFEAVEEISGSGGAPSSPEEEISGSGIRLSEGRQAPGTRIEQQCIARGKSLKGGRYCRWKERAAAASPLQGLFAHQRMEQGTFSFC